jgi:hypothetical protein
MARIRRPSAPLALSTIALIVAVGGGSYAVALNKRETRRLVVKVANRAARRQIRRRAAKLSVRHADSAGTASRADRAAVATDAGHATGADSAVRAQSAALADVATVAGHAYTAYHDGEKKVNALSYGNVGTLKVPQPGTYVVLAKLFVISHDGTSKAEGNCRLSGPGAADRTDFSLSTGLEYGAQQEAITLMITPVLTTAANVDVSCEYESTPNAVANIYVAWQKITAIQVAGRTTTGF